MFNGPVPQFSLKTREAQALYLEASNLLAQGNKEKALTSLQSAIFLLTDEKQRNPANSLFSRITTLIKRIEDPSSIQDTVQSKYPPKTTIPDLIKKYEEKATALFTNNSWREALNIYAELISLQERYKSNQPTQIGHNYWHMALCSWSIAIEKLNLPLVALFWKKNADTFFETAITFYMRSKYIKGRETNINECKQKQAELEQWAINNHLDNAALITRLQVFIQTPSALSAEEKTPNLDARSTLLFSPTVVGSSSPPSPIAKEPSVEHSEAPPSEDKVLPLSTHKHFKKRLLERWEAECQHKNCKV